MFPMRAFRLATGTLLLALAAGTAQNALAQPMGPGMGGPGLMAMGGGRQLDRMLDLVKATTDQRTQIKAIADAARTDLKAIHATGKTLHTQMQALFAQPTVDARAAETLRQQQLAVHDQASKRMLQMMVDISRVLTADQRKTLADRMAQRHSMMERHRAEREALDARTPAGK
jgi:Spy/CpxP family protein refolding chaperone